MSRRVLIVEDNARNLKLMKDVLEYCGYEVAEARTGEEGVSLANSNPPDLILMDLQLPGIDGTEALAQLRQHPTTVTIAVVAVTAFAMKDDRDRALLAGFDGYIEKPINVRVLPRQVDSFLPTGDPT
jgi:CheY-like chemotaxis protein